MLVNEALDPLRTHAALRLPYDEIRRDSWKISEIGVTDTDNLVHHESGRRVGL